MSTIAVQVAGVRKSFGAVEALRGIDLTVQKGTIVGILGPNGAGKTTLIRILTTLMQPDSGSLSVEGHDVVEESDAVRRIIGLAGQYAAVDENLTGRENLVMVGRLYHMSVALARARADELLAQFNLVDAADRTLKTYSGGMRRRVDLAASLVNRPPVLFLDEPTTGLDPASRLDLWEIIRALVRGGTTVVLTTQYMEEADYLAENIFVIDHGTVIAAGTPTELKSRVGGDVLELHISNAKKVPEARRALESLGYGLPTESAAGLLTLPVQEGSQALVRAIRALDDAGIEIEDLQLRRPSLDEAFLKLTAHAPRTI